MNPFESYPIFFFDHVESTMDEAQNLFKKNNIYQGVVVAEHQSKGRGRYGRQWLSDESSLLMTLIYPCHDINPSYFSLLMGVVLLKVFKKYNIQNITLKWPNDILINEKKVSGILIEQSLMENTNTANRILFIGVGINISYLPQKDVPYPITALTHETSNPIAKNDLLQKIIKVFITEENFLKTHGFSKIQNIWNQHHIKKTLNIHHKNTFISGEFEMIDEHGQLIIKADHGEKKYIASGDVFF